MMPVLSEKTLVDLLESNKWFRAGSPQQFIKLLETNAQGADLHTLATIIWTCSDGVSREVIHESLQKVEQDELDAFVKNLVLTSSYYDADLLIDDPIIHFETV